MLLLIINWNILLFAGNADFNNGLTVQWGKTNNLAILARQEASYYTSHPITLPLAIYPNKVIATRNIGTDAWEYSPFMITYRDETSFGIYWLNYDPTGRTSNHNSVDWVALCI